jgi:hypothetical protein
MKQRIGTPTIAALALVATCGLASAQPSTLFRNAAAIVAPVAGADIADQREIIAPPSDIDPGIAMQPPVTGARMPIIAPPAIPSEQFGIGR